MPRLAAFPKGFFDALVERRMTVFEWLDLAGQLGLDGAELYPAFLDAFDSAYLKKLRSEALLRYVLRPPIAQQRLEPRPDGSFWDALVIQSSRACGAEVLYAEDLSDGQVYDSVRVVSPFGPKTA